MRKSTKKSSPLGAFKRLVTSKKKQGKKQIVRWIKK